MKIPSRLKLALSVLVSLIVGALGSVFTTQSIQTWYVTLTKPSFNPPSWIFAPVWTTLYILMGISFWLIWTSRSSEKKHAMQLFVTQLILNGIWSPVFFGARSPGAALAIIVLLWSAIILTILIFKKISKPAAWLLVPYIAWVSFAMVLNFSIWYLNKTPQVACTMEAKLCSDGSAVGRTGPSCEFAKCPGE
jgi:tryptophan-rich sensory protein